jgi:hypothetical protein
MVPPRIASAPTMTSPSAIHAPDPPFTSMTSPPPTSIASLAKAAHRAAKPRTSPAPTTTIAPTKSRAMFFFDI